MKKRSDYKICPHCGAALDPCEKCDCMKEHHQKEKKPYKRIDKKGRKYYENF